MMYDLVNVKRFTSCVQAEGRKGAACVLTLTLLCFTGCSSSTETVFLAPPPPDGGHEAQKVASDFPAEAQPLPSSLPLFSEYYDVAGFVPSVEPAAGEVKEVIGFITEEKSECRIRHRFDRDNLLSYQWGKNKIGVDVDGMRLGFGGVELPDAVRVEYRLRLNGKPGGKRTKCLYPSAWQGVIGSGYHEFIVREEDTVWDELRDIRRDTHDYLNGAF